jgi:uncharacterized protein YuzE
MRLTYDSQADAMYIEFSSADVSSTKLIGADGNINADLDDDGNVIGIEIVGIQSCLQYIEQQSGLDIPLTDKADVASPAR